MRNKRLFIIKFQLIFIYFYIYESVNKSYPWHVKDNAVVLNQFQTVFGYTGTIRGSRVLVKYIFEDPHEPIIYFKRV